MPLDRNNELQRLAEADGHIGHAEQVIGRQLMEVERLRIRKANEGRHAVRYTELAPGRFKDFWR